MNRLRELRKERGVTQQEMAHILGVTKMSVLRWENGTHEIKIERAQEIADYFGVDVGYLLGFTDTRQEATNLSRQTSDDYTTDFIHFLKFHELALSNNEIDKAGDFIQAYNEANTGYLTALFNNKDIDKLKTLKNGDMSKLFEYSTRWINEYDNLNKAIKREKQTATTSNVIDFKQSKTLIDDLKEKQASYTTEYDDLDLYGGVSAGKGLYLYDEVVETIKYPKPIPQHDIALRVNGDSMTPMFRDKEIIFIRKTQDIHHGQIGVFILNGEGFLKKFYRDNNGIKLVSLNKMYEDITISEYDDVRLVGTVIL